MANQDYLNYTINDFDNFDCLKLSKGIYLLLLFILRGYVVWLISVANMQDHTSFLALVFPDTSLFYLSLFSGSIGLLVLLLISLRRPNAATWVQALWPHSNYLFIAALLFDFFVTLYAYYIELFSSYYWLLAQLTCVLLFSVYCVCSKRLAINLREFPKPLPDK
ncbi:DUF2919 family protein [Thalassotalea agariperforans]